MELYHKDLNAKENDTATIRAKKTRRVKDSDQRREMGK